MEGFSVMHHEYDVWIDVILDDGKLIVDYDHMRIEEFKLAGREVGDLVKDLNQYCERHSQNIKDLQSAINYAESEMGAEEVVLH